MVSSAPPSSANDSRLETQRRVAERELEAARGKGRRIEEIEQNRDFVFLYWSRLERSSIAHAGARKQHQLYRKMEVRFDVDANGELRASGPVLAGDASLLSNGT